jgi:hypothetical protein
MLQSRKLDKMQKTGEKKMPQYPFMRSPNPETSYDVGDLVEVFCDHEKNGQRIRGWLKGIVVQVDPKMVAVQFRTNVFLTDGWMVPDHILWFPQTSPHIRVPVRRAPKTDLPQAE